MKKFPIVLLCAAIALSTSVCASAQASGATGVAKRTASQCTKNQAVSWNDAVDQARALFEDGGGYYTGTRTGSNLPSGFTQNTWQGMDAAFQLADSASEPTIDVSKARPSFCSSAVYMLFLKSLLVWDTGRGAISRNAWVNLKPYTLDVTDVSGNIIPREDDGYGCWGRANANGPGLGVLVSELNAGKNYYIGNKCEYTKVSDYYDAWNQVKPDDFLKIFWNNGIGCDDNDPSGDESGHMVLFLGKKVAYAADGTRDDIITWWSSNGSHTDINAGYGIESCAESKIYRAVATQVTNPVSIDSARRIDRFNVNQWLSSLNGRHHATVAEMKQNLGLIAALEPQKVVTVQGTAPVLPNQVTARFCDPSDGSVGNVDVEWEPIPVSRYSVPGLFCVKGTVADTDWPAVCFVCVQPAAKALS